MRLELLSALNRERAARRPAAVVTDLGSGEHRLVRGSALAEDDLAEALGEHLRTGRSGTLDHAGRRLFVAVHMPPVRLLVIGAVHITQALVVMARTAGFDIVVVDPRTAFATPERFPDCRLLPMWPDDALPEIGLDPFTAVAALTHDPKIDDPALAAALQARCFYVGALGSRKSHGNRRIRLEARGIEADDLDRIRAPIGLDIGAVSPAEIAVSILGEVVLALRRKPTRAETARSEGSS